MYSSSRKQKGVLVEPSTVAGTRVKRSVKKGIQLTNSMNPVDNEQLPSVVRKLKYHCDNRHSCKQAILQFIASNDAGQYITKSKMNSNRFQLLLKQLIIKTNDSLSNGQQWGIFCFAQVLLGMGYIRDLVFDRDIVNQIWRDLQEPDQATLAVFLWILSAGKHGMSKADKETFFKQFPTATNFEAILRKAEKEMNKCNSKQLLSNRRSRPTYNSSLRTKHRSEYRSSHQF